ncbi:hypothetical protein D3C87_1728700 [compost metagenome]
MAETSALRPQKSAISSMHSIVISVESMSIATRRKSDSLRPAGTTAQSIARGPQKSSSASRSAGVSGAHSSAAATVSLRSTSSEARARVRAVSRSAGESGAVLWRIRGMADEGRALAARGFNAAKALL